MQEVGGRRVPGFAGDLQAEADFDSGGYGARAGSGSALRGGRSPLWVQDIALTARYGRNLRLPSRVSLVKSQVEA